MVVVMAVELVVELAVVLVVVVRSYGTVCAIFYCCVDEMNVQYGVGTYW